MNRLIWEDGHGYRRAKLNVPSKGKAGFTLLGGETTGIRWTNSLAIARVMERQNLMNGAGVAAGDFDGDGLCDLYFCGKDGANKLFRNKGNWQFEEVAVKAGVTCTNQSSVGTVFADLNGDGKLDLLVSSFTGPNACFLNNGNGTFSNITEAAGLVSNGAATSIALGDLNGDGSLDLYQARYAIEALLRDGIIYGVRTVNGQEVVTGRHARRLRIQNGKMFELGEPDMIWFNDAKGRFSPVTWESAFRDEDGRPVSPPQDLGLSVHIRDINGDGSPDIFVCNDFQTPDRLWLNDGAGHFQAIGRLALRNMSFASMGVDFADIDRDGQPDFITVEMLSRNHVLRMTQSNGLDPKHRIPGQIDNREEVGRNTFFWNRGDGTYAEIAYYSGVAASDWSWTPIFLDVDLDGYEDLLICNGFMFAVNDRDLGSMMRSSRDPRSLKMAPSQLAKYPPLEVPNAAWRNRGDLRFEDSAEQWGFNSRQISYGMVLADLDNDGDLDIVISCLKGPPLIYRNNSSAPRLAVRLRGKAPNTFGIGGKIEVFGGVVPLQTQEMICGGRYLSSDDTMRTFAAGSMTNQLALCVTWRSGLQSVISNVAPNYVYEIDESTAVPAPRVEKPLPVQPLFNDVSELINHKHTETDYDDFARQPLLPKKMSQLGPGIAWCDLDGDGWDDLVIGSGRSGRLAVFRNNGIGGFERWSDPAWSHDTADDQTGIVSVRSQSGTILIVGSANYESSSGNTPAATIFNLQGKHIASRGELSPTLDSSGPVAVADLDGSGKLELFVGGRFVPGKYPEPASSRIYGHEGGRWVLDEEKSKPLKNIGLVSGAVFSDLNGDGFPELILACEWGPIRIFHNDHGHLVATNFPITFSSGAFYTPHSTLNDLTGLWTSVATGDFDGDGRPDIIAGNWGLNSFHNLAPEGQWSLFYGDFNTAGQVAILESYFDKSLRKLVPWRDLDAVAQGIPWLRSRFPTHHAYSTAGIQEILGDYFPKANRLEAMCFTSMLFLNRGDHFEALPLPPQAQWAPAFALAVGDLDGDGHEDVFLSQNFFAVRTDEDRLDAGRGLLLRGDGMGNFSAVSGQESGIAVYGEQRGACLGDFDGDGRVDLAVTQNGAATKLYQNARAKPGLRVRLEGSEGNRDAIGAAMRLQFNAKSSPLREIHAGAGYWSQDSAIQVLATPQPPAHIWVRWPGGKTTISAVPAGAREITVRQSGELIPKR